MTDKFWPAYLTEPPEVVDLHQIRGFDPALGAAYGPEPITLDLNGRQYLLPPHARFVRHGLSQEGLVVEFQDADGDWHGAREITDDV